MRSDASALIERCISLIERCIETKSLRLGQALHARLAKTALALNTLLANRLVDMYAKCGSLPCAHAAFHDLSAKNHQSWNTLLAAYSREGHFTSARKLFDEMPERNLVTYNTMISHLTHHGYHKDALKLYQSMRKDTNFGITMDKFTVVGLATTCAGLEDLAALRQVHAAIILVGLELNVILFNVLIDAYGKCGDVDASRCLFDRMETRDAISWTSLIGAYTRASMLDEACQIFGMMPEHNAVSWTALISGHEQNGHEEMALELFERMMDEGVRPTPFTLVSVLSSCASLGLVGRGKQTHAFMVRRCLGMDSFNIFVHNALVDMYAKCGDMCSAMALFDRMPERDFVSWNSLVTGFAQNGHGKQSLAVFERMVAEGITPTHVTFLGVLSACSHVGLVSKGRRFLDLMEKEYGVCPRPEHYAAFVDALGRRHRLDEAMEFITCLPSSGGLGGIGAWGALLGACQVHGNLELAKRAAELLFTLDPTNGARYVALSNIYSAAGQWDDARHIRVLMKGKGLRKEVGCSWIEVRSVKYIFVAEDKSHCETEEIYQMLDTLLDQMKERKTSNVL